ncbi:site-specific integrase [Xanthomonas pisi]|nr:site-specific integrase [Xanthomonas pisi]
MDEQLISTKWPLWEDRTLGVRITSDFGLHRSINVTTSSLAIKNKRPPGYRLEGGVLPVSATLRTQILEVARSYAPFELFLMLACGFFTGMRIGSICDLRVGTLTNAARDSKLNGFVHLTIGPGATPQVHTKFGVTGQVIVPATLFNELLGYVESPRRLKRVSLASPNDRDQVFLTSAGRSYAAKSPGHGATVSVLMSRLRRDAAKAGIDLAGFHFHQTRATFATEVAETALRSGLRLNAISIVKDLLLHAHEATSLRYIRFVEDEKLKAEIGNDFSRAFLNEAVMAPHQ